MTTLEASTSARHSSGETQQQRKGWDAILMTNQDTPISDNQNSLSSPSRCSQGGRQCLDAGGVNRDEAVFSGSLSHRSQKPGVGTGAPRPHPGLSG